MIILSNVFLIALFAFLIAGIYLLNKGFGQIRYHWLFIMFFLMGVISLAAYFTTSRSTTLHQATISVKIGMAAISMFPAAFIFFVHALAKLDFNKKYLIIAILPLIAMQIIIFGGTIFNFDFTEFAENSKVKISTPFVGVYAAVVLLYFSFIAGVVVYWRKNTRLNRQKLMATIILISMFLSALILTFEFILFKNQIFGQPYFAILFTGALVLASLAYNLLFLSKGEVLAETEQLVLLSLSSDLIFFCDFSGTIIRHNHSVTQQLGFSSDELLTHTFSNFINSNEKDRFHAILSTKQAWEQEFNCVNNSGEKIPLHLRCNPIFDKYNDLAGFVLVGRDKRPDERIKKEAGQNRELQYELLKAREKASESDKLKSAFLSIITHELRTPLNGILGFTELLKIDLEDTEHFEIVDHIDKSGKRLLGTINSIIDLSMIETNKHEINKQPVNLKTLLHQKLKPYIAYAQSKKLYLEIKIEDEELMARTDERMLGHVLANLFDNAVKYTEEGGINVSLGAVKRNNRVKALFTVSDTGIGIARKDFSRIFDKFRQGSEGYNRAYEGMGIGLSICKTFVELLDGELWLDSETGKGSTFYLQIPAYFWNHSDINEVYDEDNFSELNHPNSRPCALIVEDNPSNRAFMKYLLLEKFDVDDSVSGVGAIDLAQKNQYDLVFISLNPDNELLDIEAMKKIKALPGYQKIPIAAVTTNLQKNEHADLVFQGFTHYIVKPYTRDTLLSLAEEMMLTKK